MFRLQFIAMQFIVGLIALLFALLELDGSSLYYIVFVTWTIIFTRIVLINLPCYTNTF